MRVLELFAGIGGCAAALGARNPVVCAVDQDVYAAAAYRHAWPEHRHERWNLATVKAAKLPAADLWWMSPPCQPFTIRGKRLDMDDRRCQPLLHLTGLLAERRPPHLALENVPGFETSRMRTHLLRALEGAGYHWRERLLCPSQLGIPMRRQRYYLAASRQPLPDWLPLRPHRRRVEGFLDARPAPSLRLDAELVERFAGNLPISDPVHAPWVGVFTGAYGKSPVYAGSYWATPEGPRHIAPHEILRLLGFPEGFALPADLDRRRAWKLVGNSLSVHAVREVLRVFRGTAQSAPPSKPAVNSGSISTTAR